MARLVDGAHQFEYVWRKFQLGRGAIDRIARAMSSTPIPRAIDGWVELPPVVVVAELEAFT